MSRITLAAFEETKVAAKFESLDIILEGTEEAPERVLRLRHMFRLPKAARLKVAEVQDARSASDAAQAAAADRVKAHDEAVEKRAELEALGVPEEGWPDVPEVLEGDRNEADFYQQNLDYFRDIIRLVADDDAACTTFLDHVGDDMAYLAVVFAEWSKLTQPGEAESSES